mmetsp:Transcript_37313/g.37636  ORF Transcript_37313/g.37636 Transcript_37313/m.37636 type:complete len:249 (-) Transcript_37313:131-877(-)
MDEHDPDWLSAEKDGVIKEDKISVAEKNDEEANVPSKVNEETPFLDSKSSEMKDTPPDVEKEPVVRRNACHKIFIVISAASIISLLSMACCQSLPFIFYRKFEPLEFLIRIYVTVFCVIFTLAEFEITAFLRESAMASNFLMKGVFYSFLGLVGKQQTMAMQVHDKDHNMSLNPLGKDGTTGAEILAFVITGTSWALIACGALYFVLGVFCMQALRDKLRVSYSERIEKAELEAKYRAKKHEIGPYPP